MPKGEEKKPAECHRAHPHEDDGCMLNHPQHLEVLRDRARLVREVERMRAEALRFYRADGSFETLTTPDEVVARRKFVASALVEMTNRFRLADSALSDRNEEVARLQAALACTREQRDGWELDAQQRTKNEAHWQEEATEAKAKLDDIQAVVRADEIVRAMGGDGIGLPFIIGNILARRL